MPGPFQLLARAFAEWPKLTTTSNVSDGDDVARKSGDVARGNENPGRTVIAYDTKPALAFNTPYVADSMLILRTAAGELAIGPAGDTLNAMGSGGNKTLDLACSSRNPKESTSYWSGSRPIWTPAFTPADIA